MALDVLGFATKATKKKPKGFASSDGTQKQIDLMQKNAGVLAGVVGSGADSSYQKFAEDRQKKKDQKQQVVDQQAQDAEKKKQQDNSFFNKAKRAAVNVGHAASATGRFLGTGTAKLANTAVAEGKQAGYAAEMLAASSSNNSKAFKNANEASKNAYKNDNQDHKGILGVGTAFKNGQEASSGAFTTGLKRIGGTTLQSASEIAPMGKLTKAGKVYKAGEGLVDAERGIKGLKEGATAAEKLAAAAKEVGTQAAIGTGAGAAGSAGSQLVDKGKIDVKELAKGTATGALIGGASAGLGQAFSAAKPSIMSKFKGGGKAADEMVDVMKPAEADKAAAAAHTQIGVADMSSGAEKVGVDTPIRPGVRQESTTYNVGVRTPQPLSDADYTKQFNSLSKSYDKETKALEGLAPAEQKARAAALDTKYGSKMDQLNHDYENGVLPNKTIISKMTSSTSPAGKATGGAPTSGVNVANAIEDLPKTRSKGYTPDPTKRRVSKSEASTKLQTAGYSKQEASTILQDALPDKGLSMPGSPKKIGYNEESIQKAAANFDGANSVGQTVPDVPSAAPVAGVPGETVTPGAKPSPLEPASITPGVSTDGTNLKPLAATPTSEKGTSKLGQSVQEKSINDKLISRTEAEVSGLPQYNKANMKEQAAMATDLIKTSPQDAIDIAMGKKAPPENMLPQMVYNAVEEHARRIGGEEGGQLLKDLARSKQVSNLTTMAQNVRAAAERDPHSPANMMNDIMTARAKAAEKRGVSVAKAATADKSLIKTATPKIPKETWDSFIKTLTC